MGTTVIQNVPNSSTIRLRILAMNLNEELIITREEIPRSYQTPKVFITNIMKAFDCAYTVELILETGAYRIVCTKEASKIKNPVPRATSQNKNTAQLMPDHKISSAELVQLADLKFDLAERDIADFDPQGITMAYLANVRAQNDVLRNLPNDTVNLAILGMAVIHKNKTRPSLYKALSNLRRMAKSALSAIHYSTFKFEGLAALSDAEFSVKARFIHNRAGKADVNPLMLPFGCTTVFLDEILTLLDDFLDSLVKVDEAETNRTLATYSKTLLCNTVYKEVVIVCNTGKDIYQNITPDVAKYNDYIIG